ncbi:unnamed protein product [Effrenium voratum]|uniref:Uncharacterized protein n=1 Tax=Effrenium voratum TaxID=2562239 RepID=A0AA36IHU0_9DINO|nr:unnamed protein product [Effrenium voratum]
MRVMGITTSDLAKKEVEEYGGNQTKHQLFEKKRRTLTEQVSLLASRGPTGSKPGAGDINASFLEEVLRKERETMEVMARMAKARHGQEPGRWFWHCCAQKDIQSTVIKELESRLEFEKGKKKQEENLKRMKELKKERDDKLKAAQKEADKRREKTREVRDRNERQLQRHCEELRTQLREADDRVAKCLSDIRQSHDDSIESKQVKGIEARKQKAAFEGMLVQKRQDMHDSIEEKHARKRDMLQDLLSQRVSNKEALLEKEMQCRQRVAEYLAEQQAEIEDKYEEARQRHKKAQDTREEKGTAKLEEFKTTNRKKRQAFASRYERLLVQQERDHEEFRKTWESRSLQRSASETLRRKERPEMLRAREEAEHFAALATENRERLRRANAYAVDQQIEKLLAMRQRAQVLEDKKAEADRTRAVVMRNTAVTKHELKHKVDRFKDVGVEKMLELLEDVEVEPAAKVRINEILGELGLPPLGGYSQEEEK